MSTFESETKASRSVRGLSLACCFYDYTHDKLSDLFKAVAKHGGARVEFFSNRNEALKWLKVDPSKITDKSDE